MQDEISDPYVVLGLSRTSDADELKRAYRKLSLAWHPDRHAAGTDTQRNEAERRFKLINQAYVAIGDVLRTRSEAQEAAGRTVIERSDTRVEAIRSVVASAALRVVPNLPRRTYMRVVSMVEFMLLDTLAVGDRAFEFGFDAAVREALDIASLASNSRADCLNVLDTAVDELTWRGKGADPKTWQTLLRPLEKAMHPARPATGSPPPTSVSAQTPLSPLLRPEPPFQAMQVATLVLFFVLLLPFLPLGGLPRVLLLLIDLGGLGYLTFGPRSG
ncbi:MAG: J domain-containing protein [Chloroflexota bacterium]